MSAPCPREGCEGAQGFLVLVEYAAQKTLLSSRVQLAEKSFPFVAGDHLQSWAVVKGRK